jgi:DNA-binding CsgD family transcriptional regulator/GAF domain-containing protein
MQMTTGSHDSPAGEHAFRPVGLLTDELRRACGVLELVGALTGEDRAPGAGVNAGPRAVAAALDAAQVALIERLGEPALQAAERGRISAILVQIAQSRTAVQEAELARRSDALTLVTNVMDRLRSATSVSGLFERAPAEIARVGYDRCLVSRVDGGHWIARSTYVRGDSSLADAITLAGSESPRRIDRNLLESELVRKRVPMLVSDPQRNPYVHRQLIDVTGTKAYVAAPVVVGRTVIGFVHADESTHSGSVDEFDRDLVGTLSQCLGLAVERAIHHERLQAVKRSIAGAASSVTDLVDEIIEADVDQRSCIAPTDPAPATGLGDDLRLTALPTGRLGRSELLESLTGREREVLERMAAGDTNARIASGLFISEATVKAHVKHIFRKLAVANRAEAVSRYLRA